jgi:hypothetical protein
MECPFVTIMRQVEHKACHLVSLYPVLPGRSLLDFNPSLNATVGAASLRAVSRWRSGPAWAIYKALTGHIVVL